MKFEIKYHESFLKDVKQLAKKYRSIKEDLAALADILEKQPDYGIHLGGNIYKIRLAIKSKGKGKSGGGRVITYVVLEKKSVWLLGIFDKSDLDNLTDAELNRLISTLL